MKICLFTKSWVLEWRIYFLGISNVRDLDLFWMHSEFYGFLTARIICKYNRLYSLNGDVWKCTKTNATFVIRTLKLDFHRNTKDLKIEYSSIQYLEEDFSYQSLSVYMSVYWFIREFTVIILKNGTLIIFIFSNVLLFQYFSGCFRV